MHEEIKMKYLCEIDESINTIEDFKHFLTYNKKIQFDKKNVLHFEYNCKKQQVNYNITKIKKSKGNHFIFNVISNNIDIVSSFNRMLNSLIKNVTPNKIFLLQDGISLYYSGIAYNKLHSTENSIRALLTEVMFFFGNTNWVEKEAKEILNIEKGEAVNQNFLYNRNFDQLEKFLFTNYSEYSEKELLHTILDKYSDVENIPIVIEDVKEKLPTTIWNKHFSKISNELGIEGEQLQKLLEGAYKSRNYIAHCNKFHKDDYNKFELDYNKIESAVNSMLDFIENSKLITSIDTLELEDSLMTDFLDTIVVPAQKDGFEKVFLGESEWYEIRINNEKVDNIKYIAAYQVSPISAITHFAEVKEIVSANENNYKKRVIFKGPAQRLEKPIKLGDHPNLAPQSLRYITFDQLMIAENLYDLFG